jgi:hypothetical protein
MNYSPPAGLVVYEEDPKEGAKLLTKDTQYQSYMRVGAQPDYTCWFQPSPWVELHHGVWASIPAFLHRMHSPNGNERLVAVYLGVNQHPVVLWICVYEPGSLTRDPLPRHLGGWYGLFVDKSFSEKLRVYAGHLDPQDAAHLTIDYAIDGRRGTIDGRFDNDETVTLTPRGGHNERGIAWTPAESVLFKPPTSHAAPKPAR